MNLSEAIARLDNTNDEHWTADGLPRIDAIHTLTGDETITRKQVTDAVPGYTRMIASQRASVPQPDATPSATDPSTPASNAPPAPTGAAAPPIKKPLEPPQVENENDSLQVDAPPLEIVDVLAMPIGDVLASPGLTDRGLEAINVKVAERLKAKAGIEEELKQLYAKSQILTRSKVLHDRTLKAQGKKRTHVQDYLEAQRKSREERAARAQRFIDAGTTAADVAERMRGGSKIDAAMRQRKPTPGSQRPALRVPVGR
jgi:hypothetical protein